MLLRCVHVCTFALHCTLIIYTVIDVTLYYLHTSTFIITLLLYYTDVLHLTL